MIADVNKPLTREERTATIRELFSELPFTSLGTLHRWILAEAYWREVVKKVVHSSQKCPFCLSNRLLAIEEPRGHKVDCPWLLAQEPA